MTDLPTDPPPPPPRSVLERRRSHIASQQCRDGEERVLQTTTPNILLLHAANFKGVLSVTKIRFPIHAMPGGRGNVRISNARRGRKLTSVLPILHAGCEMTMTMNVKAVVWYPTSQQPPPIDLRRSAVWFQFHAHLVSQVGSRAGTAKTLGHGFFTVTVNF
mmetsp:Transcript_30964/g.65518  ORF Transcript_30964/g.65518 Transcript_30964/m.65518 type:complete len:161 (+) Transcript_30964:729-1211(+)